jgi:hypothetical protein
MHYNLQGICGGLEAFIAPYGVAQNQRSLIKQQIHVNKIAGSKRESRGNTYSVTTVARHYHKSISRADVKIILNISEPQVLTHISLSH